MQDNSLRTLRKAAGWPTAKAFAESIGIPAPTYARYEQSGDGEDTNIPMKAAFAIADALGCSIDALVGREAISADAVRGDVQRRYDALSDDGKQLVDDFLAMAEMREERAEEQRLTALAKQYAKEARRYELMFLESIDDTPDSDGFLFFGSDADLREAFEEFAGAKVAEADARSIESACELAIKHYSRPDRHAAALPGLPVPNPRARNREHMEEMKEAHVSEIRRILEGKSAERIEGVMEGIMAAYDSAHPKLKAGEAPRVEYAIVSLEPEAHLE